jgi:release factor glutamine methyltransferase
MIEQSATVNVLLNEVARATLRLAEAGVASPRADAEELAAYVHGVRRGELHTVADTEFDMRFWEGVARRAAREPLQHITGRAYFRYIEVAVGPGVFVPRPETEIVAGWAIDTLRAMDVADPLVVDLGTGSAAIALAIAQEVPRSRVHAVEVDPSAYGWAERNIGAAPEPARRVELHHGDLRTCLPELDSQADLVISNPPYVPTGERVRMTPEVLEHDPAAALWAGADGLDAIRVLEGTARRLLRPGGCFVVEHGDGQGPSVFWLFPEDNGWVDVRNRKDLTRRDRFVTAWRAED